MNVLLLELLALALLMISGCSVVRSSSKIA